ncbi:MAG: site-specific integrase [Prevotellaceae bacterium]|jgi:integrase|nr:site-specific integrase [Prevotellaceae bacterium]
MPKSGQKKELTQVISYTPPQLYTGKEWYVGWHSYDPVLQAMRRKKIKLNHIKRKIERRTYANDLIIRVYEKLRRGWNPWIATENSKSYAAFADVCEHYGKTITKRAEEGIYRQDTYTSYMSYLRNIKKYNQELKSPITYIYQFEKQYIIDFLEHIHIDRDNSARTRDNYLGWLKSFAEFLVQKGYLKEKPTEGIASFSKWTKKKEREYLPEDILMKVKAKAEESNKYFLLASYILFYMFIRPKEMSRLKIRDINLKNRTIVITDEQSKNRRTAPITLPVKIIHLMIDLKIFEHSGDCFLFSKKMMPEKEYQSEKQFRDFWQHHIRKPMKLPDRYKFYSLKDIGITMMLRANTDILSVRDQARHSSILITDTYTPHDIARANPLIDKFECGF